MSPVEKIRPAVKDALNDVHEAYGELAELACACRNEQSEEWVCTLLRSLRLIESNLKTIAGALPSDEIGATS